MNDESIVKSSHVHQIQLNIKLKEYSLTAEWESIANTHGGGGNRWTTISSHWMSLSQQITVQKSKCSLTQYIYCTHFMFSIVLLTWVHFFLGGGSLSGSKKALIWETPIKIKKLFSEARIIALHFYSEQSYIGVHLLKLFVEASCVPRHYVGIEGRRLKGTKSFPCWRVWSSDKK